MKSYSVPEGKPDDAMKRSTCCLFSTLAVLGMALLVVGAVMYGKIFPQMYRNKVNEALVLKNGTEAAERFIQSPVPNYIKFHIFNVTNAKGVNELGEKPYVDEVGPYVFRDVKHKKIIEWNEEKGTVRYQILRSYYFQPEMSEGKLTDTINHVNALGLGLVNVFTTQKSLPALLGLTLDEMISGIRGDLVETHTVAEMLFDGFSMGKYFPEDVEHLCRLRNNCMFGFYYGRNNSLESEYEVNTGEKNIASIGHILRYNKEPTLPYHFEERCNAINGTDGLQVKPGITKSDNFYVFSADVCRSFEFVFSKEVEVEGIPALRYTIPDRVFADPNKYRDNMCFCQRDNETAECSFRSGVLQLSSCKNGSPVLASQPHFYLGEEEYLNDVKGLNPDPELHQGFLDVEPVTGAIIRGSKMVQINLLVKPDSRLKFLKYVQKKFYFPVFWAEEVGALDSEKADSFRSRVITPFQAGKWTLFSAIVLGAVMVVFVGLTCTCKHRTRKQKE